MVRTARGKAPRQRRFTERLTRRVVPALLAAFALGAAACGADGSGAQAGAGGTGGRSSLGTAVWVDMPPDVEAKVRPLVDEMARLTCERSRNCCAKYGFGSLTDCAGYSTTLIVGGAYGHIGPGDSTAFDFHFNDALAKLCLDEFKKDAKECVFADQVPLSAWEYACSGVLLVNRKGEPPVECLFDEHCALDPAPGTRCVDGRCLPEVEVPVGARCVEDEGATAVPTCLPLGFCNFGIVQCEARGQPGGPCIFETDSCVDGYGCAGGVCVLPSPDGTPCENSGSCLEGAWCGLSDASSTTEICLTTRAAGQPCEYEGQCQGPDTCVNGFCKPEALFLCQIPER